MNIVVGVTGGIAAYKTVQLVRGLVLEGHEVHVVPTEDALRFVGTPTWEAISRHPVTTSVHEGVDVVRHVALGQEADLVVVAPATANTLAAMAAGLASDLLGTTLLATEAPVLVAPAMHTQMWRHPATQANLRTLRERGVHVIGPEDGALTGGDSGLGRMTEPDDILHAALALLEGGDDLAGLRVVVTAGGTREPIDPVRFIGNRSSGRQGVAVARAAADRGAQVVLIGAHLDEVVGADAIHPRIERRSAGTAAELGAAVSAAATDADVVVMAAAVADYRPESVADRKRTKRETPLRTLTLVETDDITAALVAARRAGQTIVGFAAETPDDSETLVERARHKRARKGLDLIAANEVGWEKGFERPDNTLVIVDAADRVVAEASGSKREVADALWDAIVAVRGAGS
ncbi:bifunctional phosphopantothenoylcysteine decarboxylase/phosphopantothenate--cysteine ligase CoaBC [Microbacterium sp. X-17]|uniref:bifunctional phosphopantothenoylcysteine decarboxylase/phosphopantothenate--cysteine ligase CoaBC n=1 Tax=Microbacterium sp. X-17 TaxID=3144404 RepID=UPI0031F58835